VGSTSRRAAEVVATAAIVGIAAAAPAAASPTSLQRYVGTWAPSYRAFEGSYVRAFKPCLSGHPTTKCAARQDLAAAAALRTASLLQRTAPPVDLATDVAALQKDLRAASRTLAASAVAARAGKSSPKVWCSAEQGPCTLVMIDMGNVIGDINFTAGTDLPLPG
jgi:hypothetical protein